MTETNRQDEAAGDARSECPGHPRLLITAGPTQEPIDAVRYLSNRSSGRLGIAIASEAARRAWPTTLLLGPVSLPPPDSSQIRTMRFRTTDDLAELLEGQWPEHDVLVMAAAVADYRPRRADRGTKLRREGDGLRLDLEPTEDLLAAAAARRRPGQTIVGFALEPAEDLEKNARVKLERKAVDAIVANPLETMDAALITAILLLADGRVLETPPAISKDAFAAWLLDRVAKLR